MAALREQTIQANAFGLLKAIEQATRGSAMPVVLDQLDLRMTVDEARAAFHYLKSKGLIEANFSIFYSARLSAFGHDAINEAESTPDQTSRRFPAITYNYYVTVHTTTGAAAQQGTTAEQRPEVVTLKPGIWGISFDAKEAWRRIRAWPPGGNRCDSQDNASPCLAHARCARVCRHFGAAADVQLASWPRARDARRPAAPTRTGTVAEGVSQCRFRQVELGSVAVPYNFVMHLGPLASMR